MSYPFIAVVEVCDPTRACYELLAQSRVSIKQAKAT